MSTSLTKRWTVERTNDAINVLRGVKAVDEVAFGQVDGRWDLRGLDHSVAFGNATETSAGVLVEITDFLDLQGVTWTELDLSSCSLPELRLTRVNITNCKFDKSNLSGLRMWQTSLKDSSFIKTNLADASFGSWLDGVGDTVVHCDFSRANLRDIGSDAGTFVDCQFLDVKMRDIRFMSSVFVDCTFSGLLDDVVFDGRDLSESTGRPGHNDLRGCDFTGCNFRSVEFIAIDVTLVKLPNHSDIVVIPQFRGFLERFRVWLQNDAKSLYGDFVSDTLVEIFVEGRFGDDFSDTAASFVNLADYRLATHPSFESAIRGGLTACGVPLPR